MDASSDSPSPSPLRTDNPYSSPAVDGERPQNTAANTLNPWLSIWTKPRCTIRQIVDTDATRHVLLLAALSGIFQTLDRASSRNLGDSFSLWTIFGIAAIAGPIVGLITLYIGGVVLRWVGSGLLGGVATAKEVRAAIAWGGVPALLSNVLWVPQLAILGKEMFTFSTPTTDNAPELAGIVLITGVLEAAASVWSVVTLVKCLAEVQRFSAWRALANLVVPVVFLAVIAMIGVLVALLLPAIQFMRR